MSYLPQWTEFDMNSNLSEYSAASEIDLLEYFSVLWRSKLLIVVVVVVCAVSMGIVATLLPKTYRAEVLMVPASGDASADISLSGALGALGGIVGQSGLLPSGNRTSEEYLALLRSRSFVWAFVDEQKMMPILFADEWMEEVGEWRDPDDAPGKWDVYELIVDDGLLSILSHDDSGLYTLAIEWSDSELATQWANAMVSKLNSYLREREQERSGSNLAYLYDELKRTQVAEVRQSLFSLISQELNTAMLVNTQKEYAFRVLDPAVRPVEPVWPKPILISVAAGLIGAILSVFFVFFREGARRRRRNTAED